MLRREWFLEIGLALTMVFGAVFFGAVYSWTFMSIYALLYLFVFIFPQAVLCFFNFPTTFRLSVVSLFVLLVCQVLWASLNRFQTGEEFLKWGAFFFAFCLTQQFSISSCKRLLLWLVLLGVLEAGYGFFQVWTGHEMVLWHSKTSYLGYLTGTYINRNHVAGLLEMCLGLQLGFMMDAIGKKNVKNTFFLTAVFLLTLAGLFKTGSRMGSASLILSFLFCLPLLSRKNAGLNKGGIALLFLLSLAVGFLIVREQFLSRWLDLGNALTSGEGRWIVWKDSLRMLTDHPWFGSGLGCFSWIYPAYQSQTLTFGWAHAHNDYLELLIELGIPGFCILVVLAVNLWMKVIKQLFLVKQNYFLHWGVLIAVMSFFIHGLADFNWAIPANNLILVIISGLGVRLLDLSSPAHEDV